MAAQRQMLKRVNPVPCLNFFFDDARVVIKEERKATYLLTKYGQLLSRVCVSGVIKSVEDSEKVFKMVVKDPTGEIECVFFKEGLYIHPEANKDMIENLLSLSSKERVLVIGKIRYSQFQNEDSTRIIMENVYHIAPLAQFVNYQGALQNLIRTIQHPHKSQEIYLREAKAYYGTIKNLQGEIKDARTNIEKEWLKSEKQMNKSLSTKKPTKKEEKVAPSSDRDSDLVKCSDLILEKIDSNDGTLSKTDLNIQESEDIIQESIEKLILEGRIFINENDELIKI